MNERRNVGYALTSERSLVRYFSYFLPKGRVLAMIEGVKKGFRARKGCSRLEKKLQFLKKCECELNRIIKTEVPAG